MQDSAIPPKWSQAFLAFWPGYGKLQRPAWDSSKHKDASRKRKGPKHIQVQSREKRRWGAWWESCSFISTGESPNFLVISNGPANCVSQDQFINWLQLVLQGEQCELFPSPLCYKDNWEPRNRQEHMLPHSSQAHSCRSTQQILRADILHAVLFGHISCIYRGGVSEQTKSTAPPAAPVAGVCFSLFHPEARKKCLTSQGRFGASVQSRWDGSSSIPHQPTQVARS